MVFPGYSNGVGVSFTTGCNGGCGCSTDAYKPVCNVEEQMTYYSPCHAGCQKQHAADKVRKVTGNYGE